ncbi:hypothetical protein H257_15241 [Aphanomyces astaci]|uniref:Transmembrane protein n=1 Tax=Aphanomyces astaci TaxID=112090 RepID=W4FN37_APHAT|nr:hypothetical protein H257_15241 [Aphanomyces astaci]ETV68890.1 hypothetical protein H257_15241 [Aphanomyces astaci]|eukprot:XP_009841567.1 hypothetical protein H257_15241 [Aphanomyces astaci]
MASKSNYITMASPSATSFETPDGASTPTVAVAKLHRANRIAMIVFLLCSITGVVLWYVFDTPVGHFTRSPPANTAGACHACALLNTTTNAVNRHQSQYYYFNEPICPKALFPTADTDMILCNRAVPCCCPATSDHGGGGTYKLTCQNATECTCKYWNSRGDSTYLTLFVDAALFMFLLVLISIVACIWGCCWSCQVKKLQRSADTVNSV